MARPKKTAVVEEIRSKLADADAAVLTEYRGLTVTELRSCGRRCARPAPSTRCSRTRWPAVPSRRRARRAVASLLAARRRSRSCTVTPWSRRRRCATSAGQPGADHQGRPAGTRFLTPVEIAALAEIQPREVLLARLAGGFQAPLTKAAGLFQAFTRNFAYGLKAYVDQRVEGGEALPRRGCRDPRGRRGRATRSPKRPRPRTRAARSERSERPRRRTPTQQETRDRSNQERNRHGDHDAPQSCWTSSRT